jgi:hypothetical protein
MASARGLLSDAVADNGTAAKVVSAIVRRMRRPESGGAWVAAKHEESEHEESLHRNRVCDVVLRESDHGAGRDDGQEDRRRL